MNKPYQRPGISTAWFWEFRRRGKHYCGTAPTFKAAMDAMGTKRNDVQRDEPYTAVHGHAPFKATPETFFKKLTDEFGASRLAWGSNYPASAGPLSKLLGVARECLASVRSQDQEWIFARTAQSLYPALVDT